MIKKQKDPLEHQKKVQQDYRDKVSRLTSNVEVTKLYDLAKITCHPETGCHSFKVGFTPVCLMDHYDTISMVQCAQ